MSERSWNWRPTALFLALAGLCAALWFLKTHSPTDSDFYPRCAIHEMTGCHCPGCGSTRAIHSLLNGDVRQAIAWNGVGLPLVFVVGISTIRSLWLWTRRAEVEERKPQRRGVTIALVLFFVLFAVARNVDVPCLKFLAPHAVD